jgi:hypothetical protein
MKNGIKTLKYGIALGTALVCAMFFITCQDSSGYSETGHTDTTNPAKKGYGTISIQIAGKEARTALPSKVFDKYVYTFTKTGGTATVATPANGSFTLEAGDYTVKVDAYIGAAEPYTLVASGESSPFTISSGSNTSVTVYLNEVSTGRPGELIYTITYPAGATAEISLNKWPGLNEITLSPLTQGSGKTQTLELDAGSYLLTVLVEKNGLYGGISEALHIYPSLLTEYTKNFLDTDLLQRAGAEVSAPTGTSSVTSSSITINAVTAPGNGQTVEYAINIAATVPIFGWQDITTFSNLVANTTYYIFARSKENANYIAGAASTALQVTTPNVIIRVINGGYSGQGSLYQAIYDVPNGGTIVVDSDVKTIQLTNTIYIPNGKKFVLEGNGVTITSSLSDTDYNYAVFYFQSGVEATIRRVHFNDIKVRAIKTYYENLINIESCIFSNIVTSEYPAIWCNGSMNIKGSTFYNNSGNSGKVIFATGSVTLTGNLFYGNTATGNDPLAYKLYGGTVTSGGYNMVDVPLGIGSGQSGWVGNITDKTISSIPILPSNFKLLSGSEAANAIPSIPVGYPAFDFYGDPITTGAAAGAVQDAASSGYLVELSVNNNALGNAELSSTTAPNDDGLYPGGSITFTATQEANCELQYWLVNNQSLTDNPLTLSLNNHYKVQAVFDRPGIDLVLENASYKDFAIEARLGASEWSKVTSNKDFYQVLQKISNKVYEKFEDKFDFIFFVLNTKEDSTISNALGFAGVNLGVSNNVKGLGLSPYDQTSSFGSAGNLKSVMYFPYHNAILLGPSLHEIAHNWAAYICPTYTLGNAGDVRYDDHWGYSNAGGQLGGFKYVKELSSSGGTREYQGSMNGTYTDGFGVNANGGNGIPYSDIELYLMGMIGANELPEDFQLDIYTGLSNGSSGEKGSFKATGITSYTIDQLITKNGPRDPDANTSQRSFKVLTVILSKSQDSTASTRYDEIVGNVKWFAGLADAPANLHVYNFNQATKGRGNLEVGEITKSLK